MPLILKRFFGALALAVALVGTVHSQTKELSSNGVLLDRVAAIVNDGIVLRSDVEKQMQVISERIQQAGQQLPPRNILRQQVLERLVLQELQMERAERLGIKVPDEAVNQALTEVAARNNIKFADLPAARGAGARLPRLPRRSPPRDDACSAAPARRDRAVYVRQREVEQCIAKPSPPTADNDTTSRTSSWRFEFAPTRSCRRRTAARRVCTDAGHQPHEDFAQLAISYSDSGTAARRWRLGWAQVQPQLPSFVSEKIPAMKARRRHRSDPHAKRPAHFKVLEVRGAQAPRARRAGARAPYPAEAERGRGRRDHPPEAVADSRARPQGRELRGDRFGHLRRPGLCGIRRRSRLDGVEQLRRRVRAGRRQAERK
jgi:hypothetical protein